MNIFGNGNVVNIVSNGNSRIIVNGQVVSSNVEMKCEPFGIEELFGTDVTSLTIQADAADVVIKTGSEGKVNYFGFYAGQEKPSIKKEVVNKSMIFSFEEAQFMNNATIEVIIPKNIEKFKVFTTSGDIDCDKSLSIQNVDFTSVSGDINVDCISSMVKVKTTSGDIELTSKADSTSITSTSGDIDVVLNGGKDVCIETTSGDVDIEVLTPTNANLFSKSGKIKNRRVNDYDGMYLDVSTISGDIYLK